MHHELYGNFFENQLSRAQNLIRELSSEEWFNYPDLRNLMNFYVPRDLICADILKRDALSQLSVAAFRKERMMKDSKICFWNHYARKKCKMFSDKEIIIAKVKTAVTTLKEEKLLYSRMLIISRTRPELCPEKVIGEYELTNIPPSNFSPDGAMIVAKSNEALIDVINEMQELSSPMRYDLANPETVIIFDGMDLLDLLKSVKPMDNVGHLVNAFMTELTRELNSSSDNYSEVRLLFTRFELNSLNESRLKSSGFRKAILRYHVSEKTPIKKLETFMAHIETRVELTEFLGKKVLESFRDSKIRIVVGYGNMLYSNDSHHRSDILNQEHNLQDTTQLILLNCIDLKNNGIERLFVKSMCIDNVPVLLGHNKKISCYTKIIRSDRIITIDELYNRIGPKLSDAIIGWYAMQGENFSL